MKILLFGEFSGFFNCLGAGLRAIGHDVFMVSDGNGFKNYPADFRYDSYKSQSLGKFKTPYYVANLMLHKNLLSGYDIVFFIDPSMVSRHPFWNSSVYRYMIRNNKRSFLSGSGDTSIMAEYWMKSNQKYKNYIKGIIDGSIEKKEVLLYPNPKLRKWEEELLSSIDGYIPIWYEYAQPFRNYPCIKPTVRIPIPCKDYEYKPNIVNKKIVFFHGVPTRPLAKGTVYIKEAFARMEKKYGDKAEFHCDGGLPFNKYMDLISHTNVILDDANSYSVAMNGLFSMAKGKIVMGGAEPEGNKELGIEGVNPVLNLKPNVDQICSQIEYVINNKDKIEEWGYKSRKFVEEYHDYIKIAMEYEKIFEESLNN